MTPQQIIKEVQENASEWIEMSDTPHAFVAWVLANKIIKLNDHIEFLQKRLNHVDPTNISL